MTAFCRWGEMHASGIQVQDSDKGRPFSAASARRVSMSAVVFGFALARLATSGSVTSPYDKRPAAASTGRRIKTSMKRRSRVEGAAKLSRLDALFVVFD